MTEGSDNTNMVTINIDDENRDGVVHPAGDCNLVGESIPVIPMDNLTIGILPSEEDEKRALALLISNHVTCTRNAFVLLTAQIGLTVAVVTLLSKRPNLMPGYERMRSGQSMAPYPGVALTFSTLNVIIYLAMYSLRVRLIFKINTGLVCLVTLMLFLCNTATLGIGVLNEAFRRRLFSDFYLPTIYTLVLSFTLTMFVMILKKRLNYTKSVILFVPTVPVVGVSLKYWFEVDVINLDFLIVSTVILSLVISWVACVMMDLYTESSASSVVPRMCYLNLQLYSLWSCFSLMPVLPPWGMLLPPMLGIVWIVKNWNPE